MSPVPASQNHLGKRLNYDKDKPRVSPLFSIQHHSFHEYRFAIRQSKRSLSVERLRVAEIHQAVEAKEGVTIEKETKTYATITIQNYFRMYKKLGGMTGTADTEAEEFSSIYRLEVIVVPTNQPMIREDCPDMIFRTEMEKYDAAIEEMAARPGMLSEMYELMWVLDKPYNSWPSLHVSIATIMTLFAIRCWNDKPLLKWGIGIFCVLMCISIMTTKQHFVWDLVTGWALVATIWMWQIRPGLDRLGVKSIDEVSS